jgi:hypothetical protein
MAIHTHESRYVTQAVDIPKLVECISGVVTRPQSLK